MNNNFSKRPSDIVTPQYVFFIIFTILSIIIIQNQRVKIKPLSVSGYTIKPYNQDIWPKNE